MVGVLAFDGGNAGARVEIVQLADAVAEPAAFVARTSNVCVPAASPL